MLGKLLKYEFKATGRILLPIYLLMIMTAFIAGLTLSANPGTISVITILLFSGVAIASIVITIIVTIQRFNSNLLTNEGYLMFTLPVTTNSLILSKLIAAVVWSITGTLSGIISGLAMAIRHISWEQTRDFFITLGIFLKELTATQWLAGVEFFISTIFSYAIFVLIIYMALAIGQLPFTGKHRKGISFLAFFGIYIIYTTLSSLFGFATEMVLPTSQIEFFIGVNYNVGNYMNPGLMSLVLGFEVAMAAVLYFTTSSILKKHLNLE